MKIIPYEEKYRSDVERICIDTGSADNLVNPEHRIFTLCMYCDPYLDEGTAFLLKDDDENVQGYILCAEDIGRFEKTFKPYRKTILQECPDFAKRMDFSTYEKYKDEYPAHLHIDIEEDFTGKGSGKALMQALTDDLQKKHVKGLMVSVSRDNERACAFYKKTGFMVLEEDAYSMVLGRKF